MPTLAKKPKHRDGELGGGPTSPAGPKAHAAQRKPDEKPRDAKPPKAAARGQK